MPGVYAARLGPASNSEDSVHALWSDDQRVDVEIASAQGATSVALVDQLGARTALDVGDAPPTLRVRGSVQYLVGSGAERLQVSATESFGPNLLTGATSTASSAQPDQPARLAVDGIADANNAGD